MGVITSPDYFSINGVSSETVGLYTDTPPVPPLALQRVTTWNTGMDMDGYSPDNVFENIQITIRAFSFYPESFNFSAVYAFLAEARTLMFSRFPYRYFRVVQVDSVQPEQSYDGKKIELVITFTCEPFKYHTNNPDNTMDGQHVYLQNPGTRYSRPIYKINHSLLGETTLSVNGETMIISKDAANPIIIDCEKMLAYSEGGHNETKYTRGLFPYLASGDNLISAYMGSTFYQIIVQGNWRDY